MYMNTAPTGCMPPDRSSITPKQACQSMVQDISKIKKMVLFLADGRYGWLFSLGLLLLAAAHVPLANGQQQSTYEAKDCTMLFA